MTNPDDSSEARRREAERMHAEGLKVRDLQDPAVLARFPATQRQRVRIDQAMTQARANALKAEAEEAGGSGVAAWIAWRLCREAGSEPPDWVLAYFDRVAAQVATLTKRAEKVAWHDLAVALEFAERGRGQGSPFSRWERIQLDLCLADDVEHAIEEGATKTSACQTVAKRHTVSVQRVFDALKRVGDLRDMSIQDVK